MKLFSAESAHWYRRDGEALHSVPAKDGTMRPTTLRDARKLGLLPSVTNVLGVINKPELIEWKMTQAVLAALTLPRLNGEGEDAFAKRVVEDSQSRVRSAADFGSAFHAGAEQVAKSLEVDPVGPYAAWLNLHRGWFQANCVRVVWTERVLVNLEFGYAGTADLLVEHQAHGLTLVDYKTQALKKSGKREIGKAESPGGRPPWDYKAYKSWCQQLAAYRRAIRGSAFAKATGGQAMGCLSVIVNSTEPTAPVEHVWSEEDLRAGLESFEAALVIWRNEKGYDPRTVPHAEGAPSGGPPDAKEFGAPVLVAS